MTESITIPKASYTGADENDFAVYYLLLVGDKDLFNVDINDGTITLNEMLDREKVESYNITVLASNSQSIPSEHDSQSRLEVNIQVRGQYSGLKRVQAMFIDIFYSRY